MLFGSSHGKRIAFVSNSAWSVYNFRRDVLRNMKQQGFEIIVIASKDEYAVYLEEAGYTFAEVEFNNRTNNPVQDYFFYRRLKHIYKTYRPDFIFHYVTKPNIYGSLAAGDLNIPSVAVITGLGYAFAKENWLNRLVRNLYTKALSTVKQAWFLNQEDADMFVRKEIVAAGKIKILPGEGVNTEYFSRDAAMDNLRSTQSNFRFLMSTRLLKSKGVSVYAEAVRILVRKGYKADCRLIGFFEAHHPDSLKKEDLWQWEEEGLIIYDGFANDVRPHLQAADAFVFPSYYNEGIPRALMEAASMEVPVITSSNKGCREVVVENLTGYLCDASNPIDLAEKMEKMLNLTIHQRKNMGNAGRMLAKEKFDINKVIAYYTAVLKEA